MTILIGLLIVSLCVGVLFGAVYGWLVFGGCLLFLGLSEHLLKYYRELQKGDN